VLISRRAERRRDLRQQHSAAARPSAHSSKNLHEARSIDLDELSCAKIQVRNSEWLVESDLGGEIVLLTPC
jgi:hypothetical protein